VRSIIEEARTTTKPPVRLNRLLKWLAVPRSIWYARRQMKRMQPGRKPKPVPDHLVEEVRGLAEKYPWWGYKRIAVIARRLGIGVSNRLVYRVMKAARKRLERMTEIMHFPMPAESMSGAPA
jgi:hypothetical protein